MRFRDWLFDGLPAFEWIASFLYDMLVAAIFIFTILAVMYAVFTAHPVSPPQ